MMYINAASRIDDYKMDSNDISAYLLMKEKGIKEIITFDRKFEQINDIVCLPKFPKKFK